MNRIQAYSTPNPDNKGVTVDVEGMMVDLVTICKAGGYTKEMFLAFAAGTFDEVRVEIKIPKANKN